MTEHGDGHVDGPHCGVHGRLRALGLDPTSTVGRAEEIVSSFGLDGPPTEERTL